MPADPGSLIIRSLTWWPNAESAARANGWNKHERESLKGQFDRKEIELGEASDGTMFWRRPGETKWQT